jgi:predicted lipoprotein with Yx(FWY)xxD motif
VKRVSGLGAVLVVIMLGAAACGGGGAGASGGTNSAKKKVHVAASAAPSVTVMVADSPMGKILVDADGHTLYEFDHDTPTSSACTGACASLWPALIVSGTPHAGAGIDAAKLGVLTVTAGSQVTYAGHPLHTFANDHAPGDLTGQGFGGVWWVVGADGQKIATPTATTATAPATTVPPTSEPGPEQTSPPQTDPAPAPQPTDPPKTQPPPSTSPGTGGIAF